MGFFSFSGPKITRMEVDKMVLEAESLDQKQRDLLKEAFPGGTTSKKRFIAEVRKMRDKGLLSRIDCDSLEALAEKYY